MKTTAAQRKIAPKRRTQRDAGPWALRRAGGLQVLDAPPLIRLDWLVHGFSTRAGGSSDFGDAGGNAAGQRKSRHDGGAKSAQVLNLGFTQWDARERVLENRGKFFRAIGAQKMHVAGMSQIHSDIIHRVDFRSASASRTGDALFTREPGCLLVVQTADCVPILLADVNNRAVAAVHAGWRGTLRRIAAKTLGRMQMEFGTHPGDVIAALGPSIGRCCYEVGDDVAREFQAQFPEAKQWFDGPFDKLASGENDPSWLPWLTMMPPGHPPPSPRAHLDLIAANREILAQAGVPVRQIFASGFCTACRTDLFFSYRREGATGRLMGAIGIR